MRDPEKERLRKLEGKKHWPSHNKPLQLKLFRFKNLGRWCAKRREFVRKWRAENPERVKIHNRNLHLKRRVDPKQIIARRLRKRLSSVCRKEKVVMAEWPHLKLVGCTRPELIAHIEKQFKPGMSWNNRHLWHIDHIRPCASFDLTDSEQIKACFHYTNLQPLWAMENIKKGARVS